MIRRVFRMLASWCWAMYLVALIAWAVALVASHVVEMNGTFNWGNVNGCTLYEGRFEARLRHRRSFLAGFEVAFPGFHFKAADIAVTWTGASATYRDHELRLDLWLITAALLVPMMVGVWRHRRRTMMSGNPTSDVGRLVFRLILGVALWVIWAMIWMVLLSIPDERTPRVSFDIGTASYSIAGFGAELFEGSVNVTAGAFDDYWAEILSAGRVSGAPFPNGARVEKYSQWTVFALLAIAPIASLIFGLWPVPHPPGCCQACGYDLRGSPGGEVAKCPECGWVGVSHAAG